jgi:very-short-patch-repair endonuclease
MPSVSPTRERARRLRREQTDAEQRLWIHLRANRMMGAKFRRQHPIGKYIVDFCCIERGLVVEADGGQHADQVEADQRRTAFLMERGFHVLRFWDNEVILHLDVVLEKIAKEIGNLPHGTMPKTGRRDYYPQGRTRSTR